MKRHTKLAPQVRCLEPGCGLAMWQLNVRDGEIVYRCINLHIRKIPRPGQQIPAHTHPPDAA